MKYQSQLQYLPNTTATTTTLSIRFEIDAPSDSSRCYVGNFVLYGSLLPTKAPTAAPTKSPTKIPTESPAKVSSTTCSTDTDCLGEGDNFVCEIGNDYSFCYYSECTVNNDCIGRGDDYVCIIKGGEQDGNGYFYGTCGIPDDGESDSGQHQSVSIGVISFIIASMLHS